MDYYCLTMVFDAIHTFICVHLIKVYMHKLIVTLKLSSPYIHIYVHICTQVRNYVITYIHSVLHTYSSL